MSRPSIEPKIPISKPLFGKEELDAVQRPIETGWVVQGPFVDAFEEAFAQYTGAPHSIATSSCTSALHIAVSALGLKPGDEVIVPAFTWIATANAVEYMGARPVFCDIDLQTFNIDPDQISPLITPRTVGIIPVHLFGLCADMEAILGIAEAHDLWVVEDAACAFGSLYHGQHAGTFGEIGCFSFHPRKSITTGEGGMITTSSDEHSELTRSLRSHGAVRNTDTPPKKHADLLLPEYQHLGFNYRMTDMQGAIGCEQMKRADSILEGRRKCAQHYDDLLDDIYWMDPPQQQDDCVHSYQSYVCLFRPKPPTIDNVDQLLDGRNALMAHFHENGVSTRQGTHAPVIQDYYAEKYDLTPADFPAAYMADKLSVALPMYPQLTEADRERVIHTLKSFA